MSHFCYNQLLAMMTALQSTPGPQVLAARAHIHVGSRVLDRESVASNPLIFSALPLETVRSLVN